MSPRFDTPAAVRLACRANQVPVFPSTTIDGYLCVNLVMMAAEFATDFLAFCRANPVACPLIAHTEPGQRLAPSEIAANCDLCTDLRSYDLITHGEPTGSATDVSEWFRDDTVSFLIGSSVSFDGLLHQRGWAPGWGPAIYLTTQRCVSVGPFAGEVAVTLRTFPPAIAEQVAAFTSHFPRCHGGPLVRDDPMALGISDDDDQHLPWPGAIPTEESRLYWACGITPSRVALAAKLPMMIVHTPGNALVTDVPTMDLYEA